MAKQSKLSRNKRTEVQKLKRSLQPIKTAQNRVRKLKRLFKENPNNLQLEAALNRGSK